ncbi:glutamate receptor 5, GLUTAMATE RECEPTOR 3.7 [Hibiscus trionum]|uniref:Glutamate receptor n=1 Tax=Hibiscus trionum TaxID=183268 RepID=A0A9W7I1X4_HIBTR|nr:glutamate receptor 5, GLUTAMATE RECEPTOR 3.7 [Hibiscus trionum]
MKHLGFLSSLMIWVVSQSCLVSCKKPVSVNVGVIFTFDSVIGRAAKPAMEAAISDINGTPTILNGTRLNLIMADANCNAFLGSIEAYQVIEQEVVAFIGPQSSSLAHMISSIANGLQVPLVSYAATDPSLSAKQFPFFVRTVQSDSNQMNVMASLVDFYGWKEVIAIYVDDDYGRNGISVLNDELNKRMAKAFHKFPLPLNFTQSDIVTLLKESRLLGPRVYIVHVNPDPQLRIFSTAKKLQMMTGDYVWFATDWLSTTIDSFIPVNRTALRVLQGVVGLRQHIPESGQKKDFMSRWRKMQQKGLLKSELNTYGLCAYDTVWTVAHSIDKYINDGNNFTFSSSGKLNDTKMSEMHLEKLKVFDGGAILLEHIMNTSFSGLTGQVHFSSDRNIVTYGYDVINIGKMAVHTVGYWSDIFGFSVSPPETLRGTKKSHSESDQKLGSVIWPSGKITRPRGWVIADDERPLRVGVPRRASFVDFVTELNGTHEIAGYCIDVFTEALKFIPYNVPYKFELFGDGRSNPNYNRLVKMIADDVFDAAVGDIAIVKNRTKVVDFSQPYITTGLVILAPIHNTKSSAWVFLKPFTADMWCMTAGAFFIIAVVIWILEHRVNDAFRGPPRRQLMTMCMFSLSTLFKTNQEVTVSTLGRLVMVVWLFLLMVITSSYTANLTSILTVQQLSSPITGIDSLIAGSWPIGYQVGSFAYGYLCETLNIHKSRLVKLHSPEEYETALRLGPENGGVAAIVDELPYVELFLSKRTDFGIIGQPFTKSGWGFAFQRDSVLAVDMSTAILKLSESGKLQEIHARWFCKMGCPGERRGKSEPNQLHLVSFWGLYLLCGAITLAALLIFILRMVRQYARYKRRQRKLCRPTSSVQTSTRCSHAIFNFFDFIDEKEEAIKKMFMQCEINPVPETPTSSTT